MAEPQGQPQVWLGGPGGEGRALPTPAGHAFPGATDPLGESALVTVSRDGPSGHSERLWRVSLEDQAPISLSATASKVRSPAWAPDGSWVVYESDVHSFRDLYRVPRAGGEAVRLTQAEHGSFEPSVSPDGRHIVFASSRDGHAELYRMASDGTLVERLTQHNADDVHPRWSPKGAQIAWLSHREGAARVWLMREDGQGKHALRASEGRAVDLDMAWSPDGQRLAVVVQTSPTDVRVEVRESSGLLVGTLDGPGVDEHPAWSPDGRWLAFTSARGGAAGVYVARPDGSLVERVSPEGVVSWLPRWVP